jgi:hypothetical protein
MGRQCRVKLPPVIFREIAFQWADLHPGIIELFMDDGSSPTDRLSDKSEHWLVQWLVGDAAARQLLCEILERPPAASLRTSVQSPFYAAHEGDIDLLICDPAAPHETAVIECKRVKIHVEDEGNDSINRLEAVGEAVKQVRKLYAKFGFFQTYLAVISAVDGANRKHLNIPSRGITHDSVPNWDTSTTTFRRILQFPRREELPAEIGIILIELVQPSGRAFQEQGIVRICVHHRATPRPQHERETRGVVELMKVRA